MLQASDAGLIGSGQLILIVGPSGAGKDTLIGLAQNARAEDCRIIFPQPVVTRVASSFENNEAVTQTLFGQMLALSRWVCKPSTSLESVGGDLPAAVVNGFTVVKNLLPLIIQPVSLNLIFHMCMLTL